MDQNNELEMYEVDVKEETNTESEQTNGGSLGKALLVIGGVGALIGTGVALVKRKAGTKEERAEAKKQKKIRQLEEEGYVVLKAEDVEIRQVEVDEDSDEE